MVLKLRVRFPACWQLRLIEFLGCQHQTRLLKESRSYHKKKRLARCYDSIPNKQYQFFAMVFGTIDKLDYLLGFGSGKRGM